MAKELKYYDVTSLYSLVNKTGKIPIGHPNIIAENFENIDRYEGLIEFKLMPHKNKTPNPGTTNEMQQQAYVQSMPKITNSRYANIETQRRQ